MYSQATVNIINFTYDRTCESSSKMTLSVRAITEVSTQGGTLWFKIWGKGAGLIVWGLGFWLEKDILGFFKNIDLDNS